MPNWTQSKNIILMYYPGFTGGKFIINCLGFNQHFWPNMPLYTIGTKIDCLFSTLPKTKSECRNWDKYEFGCGNHWKESISYWFANRVDDLENQIPLVAKEILKTHYCFMVVHDGDKLLSYAKEKLPNARIFQLTNYNKFYKIAQQLKTGMYAPAGYYPPIIGEFVFDVDGTIFDYNKFFAELTRCCKHLNVPAEFDSRLEEFYNQYMSLHL